VFFPSRSLDIFRDPAKARLALRIKQPKPRSFPHAALSLSLRLIVVSPLR
jgi:hypothetical protein